MSLNNILFFLIALLILGATLLLSTMRIKGGGGDRMMAFTIDTDTNQKNKILIASIIIDVATTVVYGIILYIVLFHMTFNWLYVFMTFIGAFFVARNLYKSQREQLADYFKKIRKIDE